MIDLHGHSKKMNCFSYCCKSTIYDTGHHAQIRQLPFLMRKHVSSYEFQECTWGVDRCKTSTARAIVSEAMLSHRVMTFEVSLFGLEDRLAQTRVHYTPADLKAMGRGLMASLCQLYCSDPLFLVQLNEDIDRYLKDNPIRRQH